jgi:hypothetical protein
VLLLLQLLLLQHLALLLEPPELLLLLLQHLALLHEQHELVRP